MEHIKQNVVGSGLVPSDAKPDSGKNSGENGGRDSRRYGYKGLKGKDGNGNGARPIGLCRS